MTITAKELREVLSYDPESGIFTWRKRPGWLRNKTLAGKRAGCQLHKEKDVGKHPYRGIKIKKIRYLEHHLAWLWMTGVFPSQKIDHKDGNGLNNRFSNLRLATTAQNAANRKRPSTNSTGFKGVRRARKRFSSEIKINGKSHHLGTFDTPEEAHAAYIKAARQHHGEFARAH